MKILQVFFLLALTNTVKAGRVEFIGHKIDGNGKTNWNKDLSKVKFEEPQILEFTAVTTTVSGFSSGGFLTSNLMNVKPNLFYGAGIMAGQPPSIKMMNSKDTFNNKKVYVYTGTKDNIHQWGLNSAKFFKKHGANLKLDIVSDFDHMVPNALPEEKTWNPQRSCAIQPKKVFPTSGFHHNCGYNVARNMLTHLYQGRVKLKEMEIDHQKYGEFWAFNQDQWNTKGAKLDKYGYMYVPKACKKDKSCNLHFHFHGCMSSGKIYRDTLNRKTGLLEFAATNNIVVVFPQNDDIFDWKLKVDGKNKVYKVPYCWSSGHLNDKNHPQLLAIIKMIEDFQYFTAQK